MVLPLRLDHVRPLSGLLLLDPAERCLNQVGPWLVHERQLFCTEKVRGVVRTLVPRFVGLFWLRLKLDLLHIIIIGLNLSLRVLHSERVEARRKRTVILSFDLVHLSLVELVYTSTCDTGCHLENKSLLTGAVLCFDNLGCDVTYLDMFDRGPLNPWQGGREL